MDRLSCLKVLYDRYEKSLGFTIPEGVVSCKYFSSSFPVVFELADQKEQLLKRDVFMESVCIGGKRYDAVYPSASLISKIYSYIYELKDQRSLKVSNFLLFDDLLKGPCDRIRLESQAKPGRSFRQYDAETAIAAAWLCIVRYNPNSRRISLMPLKKLNVWDKAPTRCGNFACDPGECFCDRLIRTENEFARADHERTDSSREHPSGQRTDSSREHPSGQRTDSSREHPSGQPTDSLGEHPSGQPTDSLGEHPFGSWIDSSVYLLAFFMHVDLFDDARRKIASSERDAGSGSLYDEYPLRDVAFVECRSDPERGYELVEIDGKLIISPVNVYSSKHRLVKEKITVQHLSTHLEVVSRVTENAGFCTGMLSRGERYGDVLRSTTEHCKSFSSQ